MQRESISRASTRIVPVVVGNALGTIFSGKLVSKTKRYKLLTACSNVAGCLGFLSLLLRWHGHTQWYDNLLVMLPGVGMGVTQSTTFIHLAASLDQAEVAIAGSSWFLAQNIGALVGASLSMPLINKVLIDGLQTGLSGFADRHEVSRPCKSDIVG